MFLKFCVVPVWHVVVFMMEKIPGVQKVALCVIVLSWSIPFAPNLSHSLLSILKGEWVLTRISASILSRHRLARLLLLKGKGMGLRDLFELVMELLRCSEVSWTIQIAVGDRVRYCIIWSQQDYFHNIAFLIVLSLSTKLLEKFVIPGFPLLLSWLYVCTRLRQCFSLQHSSKMLLPWVVL